MALTVAAPPVRRVASWRRARSVASLKEVTFFPPFCNNCNVGGRLCCHSVTVIAAQRVRPLALDSTADSNQAITARKCSAEADTVLPFSVLKVASSMSHPSTELEGMSISRKANLRLSQVEGGANEPGLLMFSALTTLVHQSILPDIFC